MEHLSLAQLLKQSAMQTCYKRKNNKPVVVTEAMTAGNEIAHQKSESKYIEMRGTYKYEDLLIHYAFDEVEINDVSALLIEHKNITSGSPVEMWYFESCILQTAVYQAFAQVNSDTMLQTATFHIKNGHAKQELDLKNSYLNSQLRLGDKHYTVLVSDAKRLVEFYCRKAVASFEYATAKAFDAEYKFKEYNTLLDCLSFRPVKGNAA
jgi:hypothetical protein